MMGAPILSPTFHIGTVKIGNIEGASSFSIGNNFIEDFKSSKKHSQGLGNIHGDRNTLTHSSASLTNHEQDQPEDPGLLDQKLDKTEKKQ